MLTVLASRYGGRANPYDQRGGAYDTGGYDAPQQYGSQPYGAAPPAYGAGSQYGAQPAMGRDQYGSNVELQPLAPNGGSFGAQQDANAILNECGSIYKAIDDLESDLAQIQKLQQRSLREIESSSQSQTTTELDAMSSTVMAAFQSLNRRLKAIKVQPDSGSTRNAPQVRNVQSRLKAANLEYQKIETAYRKQLREQMERQYKIVRPDASPEEIREAVEDTSNQQVFSQALLQSTRRGEARQAASAVESRHVAIQKIESQMIELAQLFQDMEALVVQQEAAVTVIEQKGEEVVDNMHNGNVQLDGGIKSARGARRKKWWCLLIVVIIILIVVIVVVIYVKVINPPKTTKRSIVEALQARYITVGEAWTPRGRMALRDIPWTAEE